MGTGLSAYSADAGKTLAARVQLLDALDAPTLSPAQVEAYLWKTPVLGEDGWLNALPAGAAFTDISGWASAQVNFAQITCSISCPRRAKRFPIHIICFSTLPPMGESSLSLD